MSNIVKVTKEKWLSNVNSVLKEYSFKNIDDNKYELEIEQRSPGQVIVINGQRMEQPGNIVKLKYVVQLNEDGCIQNLDKHFNEIGCRNFTQILFEIYVDNIKQYSSEEFLFWDESKIKNYIKEIFNI